jgi:carbamoylphosphate synthase small subunit
MKRGTLILEDGSEFVGTFFGATANTTGEVGKMSTADLLFATMPSLFSLSNGHGGLQ